MRKYTEKIHARRMARCLEKFKDGDFCPAAFHFRTDRFSGDMWEDTDGDERHQCRVCREFIGLSPYSLRCPCHDIGCEEALRRATIALGKEAVVGTKKGE